MKKNKFTLGTDQATLDRQKAHAERNAAKQGNNPRWDRRLSNINTAIGKLPTQTDTTTTTEAPGSSGFQVDPETVKRLFPTLGQNFGDWYGGVASGYNTRLGLADDALKKKLSTQGLLGSGRETQLYADEAAKLNAEAQQTYFDQQQKNIDNFSDWYTGNQNLAQNERDSLRNSLTNLLGIASNQSNTTTGYNAASNQSSNALNQGSKQGAYTTAGAGGGGYSPTPGYDNSQSSSLTLAQILGKGQQGSSMWGDTLGKLFGGSGGGGNNSLFGVKWS